MYKFKLTITGVADDDSFVALNHELFERDPGLWLARARWEPGGCGITDSELELDKLPTTRPIEMFVGFGAAEDCWDLFTVEIPSDTPEYEIEQAAKRALEEDMEEWDALVAGDVAFYGVYHIPGLEELQY